MISLKKSTYHKKMKMKKVITRRHLKSGLSLSQIKAMLIVNLFSTEIFSRMRTSISPRTQRNNKTAQTAKSFSKWSIGYHHHMTFCLRYILNIYFQAMMERIDQTISNQLKLRARSVANLLYQIKMDQNSDLIGVEIKMKRMLVLVGQTKS